MSCSDKTPDLTVVFATHNGAATLRRTLDSFAGLPAPAGGWKLVVADNASSDETPQILEDYKARLPLSVLPVPARGKNRALHAAVALFEGPLIVFTDDDVVAEPDWLLRLAEAAAAHPDYDIFGGRIAPIWPVEPPAWLAQAVPLPILYAVIGETEAREGPINPGMIWGPNMAGR
ncbi:MAG: glycosyltransferase [Kiloniellaceae bacterium]